jgi:probable rRNA maturation factor
MEPSSRVNLTVELNLMVVFLSSSTVETVVKENYSITQDTWENWLHSWLITLYPHIPQANSYELTLRLTDDLEIQTLNARYRQQDSPTDVLAFAALEVNFPQHLSNFTAFAPLDLGDIIISVETAVRQAQTQKHSLSVELAHLAAHGLLHLLGWDHPDEESLVKMLLQQETLLKVVGLEPQTS